MWYVIYNVLLILASPVILLILLSKQRCRRGLPQRLGFLPGDDQYDARNGLPVIWVHAVSLGEVIAAVPLVRELHTREPGYRIIVTTVTETGREAVEQRLAGVAEHRYAPLDFPWVVSKVINRLKPALFLFVETEIWPNLLRALSRRSVPSLLVNGRLSSSSFRGYRIIRPLIGRALRTVTHCLMQSDRDASRIRVLGAAPERVIRTGNIKFDQPLPVPPRGATLSRDMILGADEELIVAGSTHPGEEEQILACYERLRRDFPSLVLLLAPRHIERVSQVQSAIEAHGLRAILRSALDAGQQSDGEANSRGPRVVILDTRGELAVVYRHAVLAFVGGTLIPVGGHNLLEPAVWGIPVFFGPHTDHCFEIAELLLDAGGARRVEGSDDLATAMAGLLRDRKALQGMGSAAREVVTENRGAIEHTLEVIGKVLHSSSSQGVETYRDGLAARRASGTIDSLAR